MSTLAQLTLSSRPLSWINTAFPFAAAYLLTAREIDLTLIVGTLYFLIPYNLAMYGINDVFDYESDLRNPRKGGVEGALLDPSIHRTTLVAALVTNVPFLVYLVIVGDPLSWFVLAISVFAVIAYSMKGLRFKEKPFLDSLTSSTHFVARSSCGASRATPSERCRTCSPIAREGSPRSRPSSAHAPRRASRSSSTSPPASCCSAPSGPARSRPSRRCPTS